MILVRDIQTAIAREHGMDPAMMREPDQLGARLRGKAWARQEAMRLAMLLTELSSVRIGQLFGGRDHSTVLEACKRVDKRRASDITIHNRLRRVSLELVRR